MKKNGTTSKGTTRWRCTNKTCGASSTKTRPDLATSAAFRAFITYVTGTDSLSTLAQAHNCSRWTLNRRFAPFWLIDVPTTTCPHRVYDQVFIDGTYLAGGCLLIAVSKTHVLAWHWAKTENTAAYTHLLSRLAPPLCVVLDGGQGALSAIKKCWPDTIIQRCLVHAQRAVRRHTTIRAKTQAGKAIYRLALKLTQITTQDQATEWLLQLNNYSQVYNDFLNEKTPIPPRRRKGNKDWEYTHPRVRKAHNLLIYLNKNGWLFAYLQPPATASSPADWVATTNSLEGGINAGVKLHAHRHRGLSPEHQRRAIDWWLHSKTQLPSDPLTIARQCNFGQNQLAKVKILTTQNENQADQHTGRPALYDNAIPTEYNHSLGIQKGHIH